MYEGLGILATCAMGFFVGAIVGIACGALFSALI